MLYWTKVKTLHYNILYFVRKYWTKSIITFSRHPASDSSKLHQFVSLMFELCSLLCLKLCSLNFALRMRKKNCYAYQNSPYLCCVITEENCLITWNKLRNQFRIYQICNKKGKCLPLTKTNKEYFMNITFPDWVIVKNIIARNVIITFPEMIFSTITKSENVIFILLYRILDPLFSTALGLPWWGEFQRARLG